MRRKYISLKRLDHESGVAYEAFLTYIELGHGRSLEKARVKLGRREGYIRTLETWSSRHEWQERLRQYHLDLEKELENRQREILVHERDRYLKNVINLNDQLEKMIAESQTMRQSKRVMVDDPRDAGLPEPQRRKMEVITLRINTRDMRELVTTVGALNKDLRTALGMPVNVDVKTDGQKLAWPTIIEIAPEIAMPEEGDDSDAPEPIEIHANGHSSNGHKKNGRKRSQ